MLYNIIRPSKIPYSAGKCAILPNPNRITTKAKALNVSWALFSCDGEPSRARSCKGRRRAKKAVLHTQDKLLLWSMMAHGGRDVAPQRQIPISH